jgi:5-methylthioadenosine/S-adenosylhomocysteine deaminase
LELFGIDSNQSKLAWQRWEEKWCGLKETSNRDIQLAQKQARLQFTVAPHAPYTVCPSLWQEASAWSDNHQLPLLCHVAESLPECNWIANQDKEVDEYLAFVKAKTQANMPAHMEWKGKGLSVIEHLSTHQLLNHRTIAAHAVHLKNQDIDLLAEQKIKVAHCPRSNARLHNGISPLTKLRAQGVEVGFGTDSLASCDDLNILSEARFAWNLHRATNPTFDKDAQEAIFWLTLGAAKMLALQDRIGSLDIGKDADLSVFSLDDIPPFCNNPYDLLFYGGCNLHSSYVQGRALVQEGQLLYSRDAVLS